MLALDDPRWRLLEGAYGPAGPVPAMLRAVAADPGDGNPVWDDVFSWLCHQGTVYEASFAAVPHVVTIGARAQSAGAPRELTMLWSFVGAVAVGDPMTPAPQDLDDAYRAALRDAASCVQREIETGGGDAMAVWYLLQAAAGVRGLGALARAIESVAGGDLDVTCPSCGASFVASLADATPRGRALDALDPAPWAWTDEDAPGRLVGLARRARRADVVDALARLEGTLPCTDCGEVFALRPALAAACGG